MTPRERLIVALDAPSVEAAQALVGRLGDSVSFYKIGMELIYGGGGLALAQGLIGSGRRVFVDLKLHDIPNTVVGAVRAVLPLSPRMLTVHASGGPAMIAAARATAEMAGANRPMILGVTVLTSLDELALAATGVFGGPTAQVLRLGRLALAAGADGLVCSPLEVAMLRQALGPGATLVVPGIRPAGADAGDQARVMTPAQAVAAGADWIVVGRPITAAPDPARAAAEVSAEAR